MSLKIAKSDPFDGVPTLTVPSVFGLSPDKPALWRLSAVGARPIRLRVEGLPAGLTLRDGIVSGTTSAAGEHRLVVTAENALGRDTKAVRLQVAPDGMLRTPLLGFTTWNAFAAGVTQKDVERTADLLVSTGLADYGYAYVNLDSGWQGEYGGEYDAICPNEKFPDMKAMVAKLHALGLKGGIYSTPFLNAWGCPAGRASIPGCTRGKPDDRFPPYNGGIGRERKEANNVRQWVQWGIDYLKYDWRPTDPVNADLMKQALLRAPREIAFCVTILASHEYARYWKKYCCSWRDNEDTHDLWENIVKRLGTVGTWEQDVGPGHFYDLDMLAIGPMHMNRGTSRLTEDEEQLAYTLHAFFPSPIQLSCRLDEITEFEFDLLGNEELIAINQDALCDYPALVREIVARDKDYRIFRRELEDGGSAVAVFNLSDQALTDQLRLRKTCAIRNVWEKRALGESNRLAFTLGAHSAAVFRLSA